MAMVLAIFCTTLPARADGIVLDADRTQIAFHLDSTLHEVEGTAHLSSGNVAFNPETGVMRGRVVVDARSLETGNGLRDRSMQKKVLESERYPTIAFLPETFEAGPTVDGVAPVVLRGELEIHGAKHPFEIRTRVALQGEEAHVEARFVIPHVAWGMRDMSNFLLHVDEQVTVEIDAVGRIVRHGEPAGERSSGSS